MQSVLVPGAWKGRATITSLPFHERKNSLHERVAADTFKGTEVRQSYATWASTVGVSCFIVRAFPFRLSCSGHT